MISKEDFFKIAGVNQHSQFQQFLKDIIFDRPRREKFYHDILDIDYQCVNDDLFRTYFEKYAAERKSNQQDFTPQSIAKLLAALSNQNSKKTGWSCYDPAAGTGTLIITKWNKDRLKVSPFNYYPYNYFYLAEEKSDVAIPYLINNLAIRGMNAVVIHGDTIERKANQVYFIQNAKNDFLHFSSINVMPHSEDIMKEFDIREWLEEPIDYIEDSLEDVKWLTIKKGVKHDIK